MAWPKQVAEKWELRDVYLISWRRLPNWRAGYCYGTRITYIDKQNYYSLGYERWDMQQKFWRAQNPFKVILYLPDTHEPFYGFNSSATTLFDFQNSHASDGFMYNQKTNQECGKYQDTAKYSTPAGLQQVMQ